jgi:hypothetical protein
MRDYDIEIAAMAKQLRIGVRRNDKVPYWAQ